MSWGIAIVGRGDHTGCGKNTLVPGFIFVAAENLHYPLVRYPLVKALVVSRRILRWGGFLL